MADLFWRNQTLWSEFFCLRKQRHERTRPAFNLEFVVVFFFFLVPINVTVSERNKRNLTVVWSPVNSSVDILGYRIRYRRNDTQAFKFHVMNCTSQSAAGTNDQIGNESSSYNMSCFNSIFVCSNRTSVSLTNLKVYTFYWIDVTAFGNSRFGTQSSPIINPTSEAGM